METSNRTALVTGAGRGIGRAIAVRLARERRVIAVDRDAAMAEEVAANLRAAGHEAVGEALDVRDQRSARALVERRGPLAVLVDNAAIASDMAAFAELAPERLREMIAVNLLEP